MQENIEDTYKELWDEKNFDQLFATVLGTSEIDPETANRIGQTLLVAHETMGNKRRKDGTTMFSHCAHVAAEIAFANRNELPNSKIGLRLAEAGLLHELCEEGMPEIGQYWKSLSSDGEKVDPKRVWSRINTFRRHWRDRLPPETKVNDSIWLMEPVIFDKKPDVMEKYSAFIYQLTRAPRPLLIVELADRLRDISETEYAFKNGSTKDAAYKIFEKQARLKFMMKTFDQLPWPEQLRPVYENMKNLINMRFEDIDVYHLTKLFGDNEGVIHFGSQEEIDYQTAYTNFMFFSPLRDTLDEYLEATGLVN